MPLTYAIALSTESSDSLVPCAVKFAGDRVVNVTVISGLTVGIDVTSSFAPVAPAPGFLVQLVSPGAGATCIATIETDHPI